MEKKLNESEMRSLMDAQHREIEAKVLLADHELFAQKKRDILLRSIDNASAAREMIFDAMILSRGLSTSEWRVNLELMEVVPIKMIPESQSGIDCITECLQENQVEEMRSSCITLREKDE
jgi:hypothetical protein